MAVFISLLLFLLGASIASFAGLLAQRMQSMPEGASIRELVGGRSTCDGCGEPLTARELVPVLGWILVRGRCDRCGHGVSPAYPIMEFATGAAAVALLFLNRGGAGDLAAVEFILLLGVVAVWIEAATGRIQVGLMGLLLAGGLVLSPFEADPLNRVGAAALAGVVGLAIAWLTRRRYRLPMRASGLCAAAGAGWLGFGSVGLYLLVLCVLVDVSLAASRRVTSWAGPWIVAPTVVATLVLALWGGG